VLFKVRRGSLGGPGGRVAQLAELHGWDLGGPGFEVRHSTGRQKASTELSRTSFLLGRMFKIVSTLV